VAGDQKKGGEENRTIVFVDQSGFYLLPFVMRTYAPMGKTPEIRAPLSRDHLSSMSGITPDGRLYMKIQRKSYKGKDAAGFLKHLLRHIDGKLLVLWDRSPIHRSQVVRDLLASKEGSGIHLEQFPAYAPELNPDEGVWNHLKRVELKNVNCQDLDELYNELRKAKERLRHKTEVIKSFSRMTGLY
jgi:transposase